MSSKRLGCGMILVCLWATGCHHIKSDYPAFLAEHGADSDLPPTSLRASYAIEPRTSLHYYEVRSVAAGYGNRWIIEFGDMLDQTMQADYVQRAFVRPSHYTPGRVEPGYALLFELVDYRITSFTAHIQLRISLRHDGQPMFSKLYQADGPEHFGKVAWGGAFTMRGAIQDSTKGAVDQILRTFLNELEPLLKPTQSPPLQAAR